MGIRKSSGLGRKGISGLSRNGISTFGRTFPIANDVKYRGEEYDPHSPYIPKGQYAVATKIVALDGSGDFEDIQSAVDDLPADGGVVYIKEGTYNITSTISIPKNNVALIGSGNGTIIKGTNANYIILISISSKSRIILKDFLLDGNYPNLSGSIRNGIYLYASSYCRISNCTLTNVGDSSIELEQNSNHNIITDCYTHNAGPYGDGLKLFLGSSRNIISNSILSGGIYSSGIRIHSDGLDPCNNTIQSCICSGREGMSFSGGSNNILIGNICNSGNQGIYIEDPSAQNILIGNQCSNNAYGIHLFDSDCDKTIVLGNICLNNSTNNILNNGINTQIGHNITN